MRLSFFCHRCYQQQAYGPSCSYGHTGPLSALPGHDYTRPLLHHNPGSADISGPPHLYIIPSPGLEHNSAAGPGSARQYGAPHRTLTSLLPSDGEETNTGNTNSAKEFSIRVISVWRHVSGESFTDPFFFFFNCFKKENVNLNVIFTVMLRCLWAAPRRGCWADKRLCLW